MERAGNKIIPVVLASLLWSATLVNGQTVPIDDSATCNIVLFTDTLAEYGSCTAEIALTPNVTQQLNNLLMVFKASEPGDTAHLSTRLPTPLPRVSNFINWCPELCTIVRPESVWLNGQLWGVVQLPYYKQYYISCTCTNQFCKGKVQKSRVRGFRGNKKRRPLFWKGRCVQGDSWIRLLVYRGTVLSWRFIRYHRDCCCAPFKF